MTTSLPPDPKRRRDRPSTELVWWRPLAALLLDWGLIVAGFAIAILFPHPLAYLLAAVLVARTQLALAVLMHESAHGLLFRRHGLNDFVGQAFAAGPLMVSLPAYRNGHLAHHRAPMAQDDPVAVIFQISDYPLTRRQLAFRLFKDLTGIGYVSSVCRLIWGADGALLKARRGSRSAAESSSLSTAFVVLSILISHGALVAALAAAGHPALYLGLWILPALTFLQVMGRMRAIMEHAGHSPSEDQRLNARTIVRPSWQTFFFGPHAVHYHIEHHAHVRVPFYRLRQAHAAMAAAGQLPAANLYRDYGAILREVTNR